MERRRLLIGLVVTLLTLPLLLLDNFAQASGEADAELVTAGAPAAFEQARPAAVPASPATAPPTTEAAPPVTEPAPPPTEAPTTTQAPRRKAASTAPPDTIAPPEDEVEVASNAEEGGATWYDYRLGECAHRTLPFGTVVTVTSLSNGNTTTCTVTDRGPFGGGRIVDLDRATFAQLADPGAGVIDVRITW